MTKARYEVVGRLPPEHGGKTVLAVMGPARKLVVLRPVGAGLAIDAPSLHPQLPAPLGIEQHEGAPCVVYEFFAGATLHEIVDVYRAQDQLPPLGLAVRVVMDAARILHAAHGQAVVHGGISDGSLLLGFDGDVRVLDLGLRKANRFTAPEAASRGAPTEKSDVFSLAASLHAALTGFDRNYAQVLAKAPSSAQFPPPSQVHPDATPELDSLLMRAMFPDPSSRLASAAELADDLERIVGASLPAREACATRLKQLFEERLDGLRTLLPRPPPEPRVSRPSMPAMPAAQPSAPPPPRKSGSRPPVIPVGTQPETANPIGRRPTPAEVKAAFGDDGAEPDERTVVADPDPRLSNMAQQKKGEPPASAPPPRPSGSRKPLKKPAAPLPEVPWEAGPLGAGIPTSEREAQQVPTEAVPAGGELAIEDVPTGLTRRASGSHAAAKGGSSREEKARAVGQELVDTGEVEPFDDPQLDDLRDQPTVVRVSGAHQKLKLDPSSPDFAAAFGDSELGEPGTAVITSKEGPKARAAAAPPDALLEEPGTGPGLVSPLEVPDTGVLSHNKPKAPPPDDAPVKKQKAKPARVLLASMLVVIVSGFGFVTVKNPTLVRAKLDAALVKWGFKKAPPPPDEPVAPVVAESPDGGVAGPVAVAAPVLDVDGGALPDDDADGGEEEEDEDDDGGTVSASDAGAHADGGPVPHKVKKKKKKKKRRSKEWWQTQQ